MKIFLLIFFFAFGSVSLAQNLEKVTVQAKLISYDKNFVVVEMKKNKRVKIERSKVLTPLEGLMPNKSYIQFTFSTEQLGVLLD